MIPSADSLFSGPQSLIGRAHELACIEQALTNPDFQHQVFYVEGQGGIGKTRLLAEVRDRMRYRDEVLTTDLIDLYLTRHHQPIWIMGAIASQLQDCLRLREDTATASLFARYWQAEARFLAAHAELSDVEHLQRQLVDSAFIEDYRAVAQVHRVLLIIDTFEKLHPELDETEPFNFRHTSRLERWLIRLLTTLPNTLVLLAGRPRTRQRQLLVETLGDHLTLLPIQPFTEAETAAFIYATLADLPETERTLFAPDVLHLVSAGRPVVLTIAMACARAHAIDVMALPAGFEEQYPNNREKLSDVFVDFIIKELQENEQDFATMLMQAVYLRKGLRLPLLERIAYDEGDSPDAQALTDQLVAFSRFPFVKSVGTLEVLLHDEMYELLFDKFPERIAFPWYAAAIAYLDDQLLQIQAATRMGQLDTQPVMQAYQVERLFYQMSLDIRNGYRNYRELSNSAINARDEDFDTQLQDELARFFDPDTVWGKAYRRKLRDSGLSWEQVIFDEGVRWVHRRISAHIEGASANRYQEAIAIAEAVRQRFPTIYAENRLARSDLDAVQLQAEVYIPETTPRGSAIGANYTRLVADLEALLAHPQAADASATHLSEPDYARLILANAYNYWGYYERTREHFQSAIAKYSAAVRLYKQLGPEVHNLLATTLNNLGFALSRQGESRSALKFIRSALDIVNIQGANYRIATIMNTLAQVQMDNNEVEVAMENVIRARQMFEDMHSVRGRALCAIAEGRARSRVAGRLYEQEDATIERIDEAYQEAITSYREALDLFDQQLSGEISRRIEGRVGESKVYLDWAALRRHHGADGQAQLEQATTLLQEAQQLCGPQTPETTRVTILETSAAIAVDLGLYTTALAQLDQARQQIPAPFAIQPEAAGSVSNETHELRIFWLRLAQVELQYALCRFGLREYQAACDHLLCAYASMFRFLPPDQPIIPKFRLLGKASLERIGNTDTLMHLQERTSQTADDLGINGRPREMINQLFRETIIELTLT